MIKRILYLYILIMCPGLAFAQINTDRVMAIGRNALYFEDYVLSIQYFNQVVNAKPYFGRSLLFIGGLAKINLDDFQGAEKRLLGSYRTESVCSQRLSGAGDWHVSVRITMPVPLKII